MKGISTNLEQVAFWIESLGVCSHISMAIDDMYTPDKETVSPHTKHKEEGGKRRELDEQDRQRILDELQKHSHPLTNHSSESLYNINNGQVASGNDVNIQDAVKIGKEMHTAFLSSLPDGFHKPIKRMVNTMQVLKKSVKVNHKPVYDLEAVFALLLVVGQKKDHWLGFSLSARVVPSASIANRRLWLPPKVEEVRPSIPSRHQDSEPSSSRHSVGGCLSVAVPRLWPSSGTAGDLAEGMKTHLINYRDYRGAETYVIFDQYDDISAKDHERQRRAGKGSTEL